MSKIGRVVQEIMEKFEGNVPEGYTLADYFRDKEKEDGNKQASNRDSKQEDPDHKTIR